VTDLPSGNTATSRCPNTTFWLYVNAFYFVIILLTLLSLAVFLSWLGWGLIIWQKPLLIFTALKLTEEDPTRVP